MENDLNSNLIQSLWIGGQLSKVECLGIQSFIDYGHDFHLYTYEEIKNAPKGTIIHDAASIIPECEIFRFNEGWGKGSVSGFADLFRLLLIQKKGGWWVDMDVICLKKLDFEADTVLCSSYEGEYGSLANNCVFKAPKNSFFLKYCIDYLSTVDVKTLTFGMAGPFLFQKAIKELQLENNLVPYNYFNPLNWKNVNELVLGNLTTINRIKELVRPIIKPSTMMGRRISSESYTVHFWNEVWRSSNLDKNATYNSNSLFERLKRKHCI